MWKIQGFEINNIILIISDPKKPTKKTLEKKLIKKNLIAQFNTNAQTRSL
jgi:hypothetical protein